MSNIDATQKSVEKLAALRLEWMSMIPAHHNKASSTAQPLDSNRQSVPRHAHSMARTLLNGWSQDEVGQAVYTVLQQSIVRYAQTKPFHLMGWSIALGFAMIWVKPWRRLPFGLSATLGSLIAAKGYRWFMSVVAKKF